MDNTTQQTTLTWQTSILDKLKAFDRFREQQKINLWNQNIDNQFKSMENLCTTSLSAKDPETQKKAKNCMKISEALMAGREAAAKNGKDWSNATDSQVYEALKEMYPDIKDRMATYIQDDNMDREWFKALMWWEEKQKKTIWQSIKDILSWNSWNWYDTLPLWLKSTIGTSLWLAEGVIDAWRRVWNNLWDIKEIAWSDLSFPEKYNKILLWEIIADSFWWSVWDVIGWWLWGFVKGMTTQYARDKMSDAASGFLQSLMESNSGEKIMNFWNSLSDEEQKEAKDYLTYLDGMLNLIGLKWAKASKPLLEKWATIVSKWIDKWVEAGEKGLKQVSKAIEGQYTKKLVDQAEGNIKELNQIADKIGRGKTTDVKTTVESLKEIDISNVKTFKGLDDAIETKKKELVTEIDKLLEWSEGKITLEDLEKIRTTEGKYWNIEYKNDSITTAFDDLRKLYEATNDNKSLAKLDELEKHFYENWFTRKEANDFAREYWNEFRNKAFNKDWSRKISNVGEGYENTREQIKELVREWLPDDTVKNLDKKYSQLKNTQDLIKKTVEEVNKFQRNLKENGLLSKIWGWLAKTVELVGQGLTLGTGKWFIQKLAKSAWLLSADAGKMTIDEIEKQLPKLLRRFKELNQKIQKSEWVKAEIMLKQAEKEFAKASKNWDWLAGEIIYNKWWTYDLKNNVNLWWEDFTSVSPYPNRTLIIPKEELTDQTIKDYARENMSAIMRDWHALWGRVDDNDKVYLDVAVTLPNKYKGKAIELWKKYNQKAVFDLKNLEEIPVWWNW